jgi:hypothetical protein
MNSTISTCWLQAKSGGGNMREGYILSARISKLAAFGAIFVIWACVGIGTANAQVTTGTILGNVTDASGAQVAGATITATNELTGFSRVATTGADGTYLIQSLPIGNNYRLESRRDGFKTDVKNGITLQVGQNMRQDIQLQVGEVAEKIEVTSTAPLVDTYSATKGEVVDSVRLTELPLNGRSPLQLASTVAGATVVSVPIDLSGGSRSGAYINVNGSIKEAMDQQLDGIRFAGAYSNSGLDYPNPDALAEFKLITNPLSAEYGMWSGAVFTAVVKSGTNAIHGEAFEFLRNTALNARNYFAPTKTPYHQNQFGVSAGGPIIRNRLFWFGSYQGLRISQDTVISSVPLTADERQGLITSATPVKDPTTGVPFPQNAAGQYVIPTNRIDPVSAYLLNNFIPVAPAGGGAVFTTSPSTNDSNQYVGKIDYNLTKSDQLNGMIFFERIVPLNAFPTGPYPGYGSYKANGPQTDLAISETHTFSPTFMNEARFGYAAQHETRSEVGGTSPATMGINGWDYDYWYQNHPNVPMVSPTIGVAGRFTVGDYGANNWIEGGANWQASDFVTLLRGKHNMKMGVDLYRRQHHLDVDEVQTGDFGFDGTKSGNPTADFLLGALDSALRIQYVFNPGYESWSRMFFFQDDWKVNRRLTLNLGVRYELHEPFKEYRANSDEFHLGVPGFGTFDFDAYAAGVHSSVFPAAPLGMVYPGDKTPDFPGGVPSTLIPTDKKQIQPRIGLAWDPFGNGRTSVRASAGLFTDALSAWSTSFAGNNLPYIAINSNPDPPGTLSDPYAGLTPFPQVSAANIATDPGFFQLQSDATSWPKNFVHPRITSLTFGIQQQITNNLMVEAGYVGKLTRHGELWVSKNLATFIPGTDPVTGEPYSTTANIQQRRLIDPGQLGAIGQYESEGNSSFHSFQSTIRYRKSNFTFTNSYTWSHSIDIASCDFACLAGQDPNNLVGSRGSSDFDRRHVDGLSLVYDVPTTYRGSSGALRQVINGWEVTGLMTASTGAPFSILDGYDASLTGAGSPLGGTQGRPDIVGNPNLSGGRSRSEEIAEWFNPAAYQINAPGTYGTSGRNSLYGPGSFNTDLGVFKNFNLGERAHLQFRSEFFNVFNNVNLGNPDNSMLSPTIGRITSAGSPRIIQFGLKLGW